MGFPVVYIYCCVHWVFWPRSASEVATLLLLLAYVYSDGFHG